MQQSRRTVIGAAGGLAIAAGLGVRGGHVARVARAHDEGGPHPAHIHVGTVDAPGEVVIPLSDVSGEFLVDGEASAGDTVGQETAVGTQGSVTMVDVALSDIIEGGHVVMVHKSAEEIDVYVAGGDVGGVMMGANDLVVGLKELNESSLSGVAILHDNGDETTTISVYLTARDDGHSADGDEEDPDAEDDDADDSGDAGGEAVAIQDFAFDPEALEISIGTTVTWTNNDSAPHTATAVDGAFQSGKLDQGGTFSHTFEEAGTFEYFCEYHANMTATITVS